MVGKNIVPGTSPLCPAYYIDNFSDPNSGWPIVEDSDVKLAYAGGEYQILVKKASSGMSVTPGAKAIDFTASVSARRISGSGGYYGILFGLNEDWSQYYEFDIGANSYSIWKYNNGWTTLKGWTSSGYIATGTGTNRLKVVRNGSSIAVYVNNQYLTTVTDSSYTDLRRIALAAGSPSSGAIDIRFDDFSMYPVSCGPGVRSPSGTDFAMGKPEIRSGARPPSLDQP
jgi:hypothetical protein